jgi:hypothetical protein
MTETADAASLAQTERALIEHTTLCSVLPSGSRAICRRLCYSLFFFFFLCCGYTTTHLIIFTMLTLCAHSSAAAAPLVDRVISA